MLVASVLLDLDNVRHVTMTSKNSGGAVERDAHYDITLSTDGGRLEVREFGESPAAPLNLFRCQ